MTLTKATRNLRNNRKSGAKTTTTEIIVMARSNRNLCQHNMVDRTPRYYTVGHTFTKDGTRVEVVRDHKLAKALHRHAQYLKRRNNEELLKGTNDEV